MSRAASPRAQAARVAPTAVVVNVVGVDRVRAADMMASASRVHRVSRNVMGGNAAATAVAACAGFVTKVRAVPTRGNASFL